MNCVYLEINSVDDVVSVINEAKKIGFMKDISTEKVGSILSTKEFPIRIPIEINQVFSLVEGSNPMIPMIKKLYGKKIEETILQAIVKIANE